ncbi:hypothetical protein CKY04_15135 [Photorhabdus sp. S8-52]|nr:hypothetical protein CKY05_15485 [Photorhabdus sp. S10-54]RAW96767.1 hypothetical protein CKY03_14830 [Photorhabdus sp. S9-53]RAX01074.1 hypothetical protein CKY04_15135 [Photorhabdus sp. S8-52]
MQIIAAMAEFKQDLLIERTHFGIARAKAVGKHMGRRSVLNEEQQRVVIEHLKVGSSVSANVHVHHVHILLFPEQPTVKILNLSKHHPLLHSQAPTGR